MERSNLPALLAFLALLFCVFAVTASPSPPAYFCPEDCTCTLSQHTHKPTLHAQCNSTNGLKLSRVPLMATIPIHSIDLSYLGLTRVGRILDMLPNVTSVDLSHNELHELGHFSKRIKKLNLKHNRLTSAKLLKLPQHLQVLNLQHNDITDLPLSLTHLRHLEQLELSHNAINCSCTTLQVRDWLQQQHIYMEKPVICNLPAEASGKSWLQMRRVDVCQKELSGWYDSNFDENELMMGDQPAEDREEKEEEELGKDFLPIDNKRLVRTAEQAPPVESEVEGSGDLTITNMELTAAKQSSEKSVEVSVEEPNVKQLTDELQQDERDNDEGSGSGDGLVIDHLNFQEPNKVGDFEPPEDSHESKSETDQQHNDDDTYDSKPGEDPRTSLESKFKNFETIGIYENSSDGPKAVSEEVIVPVVHTQLNSGTGDETGKGSSSDVVTDAPEVIDKKKVLSAEIAKKDDSNAIYFLLGVIALIVLGLILFVAIKRCKYNNNAAARDAEAQRQTELLDMDKKNPGKLLARNGHEHSPLIGEKTKLDDAQIVNGSSKKPYDSKDGAGQQPLLNGNGAANGDAKDVPTINEPSTGEPAPHEYYPITPRYPTPQSPRASKYAQHPAQADGAEQNNNEPDGAFLPSSPKSGRYSPVYSPETGRVKIKLTETPKPKTPMLVTRSKSNAGDIITTPIQGTGGAGYQLEPTHQVAVGGANGFAGH